MNLNFKGILVDGHGAGEITSGATMPPSCTTRTVSLSRPGEQAQHAQLTQQAQLAQYAQLAQHMQQAQHAQQAAGAARAAARSAGARARVRRGAPPG